MKRSYISLFWVYVISFFLIGGCSKDKEDEYIAFADEHFSQATYRAIEFELACNAQYGDSGAYNRDIDTWTDEEWEKKIHFLPREGFTHELPTADDRTSSSSRESQYYEMIGKYIHQFGFGWDDAIGDDPGTSWFDGESPNSIHYMDLRNDANTGGCIGPFQVT
ncbi:MAG: hypothetical protein P9X24_05000 [Candidatus Hatepunaea meridiana]|nr:hypothetical protein [Candidatus Hatepunaea meridiana]